MTFYTRRTIRIAPHVLALCLGLVLTAQAAFADTITLAWDASADSTVVGYVVRVGLSPGSYSQSFDVGGATTFTFSGATAGTAYYFTVVSYAPGPTLGLPTNELKAFSNAPPTLASPGAQTATVGTSTSLQLVGTDLYGDPLTYSATSLPPGLSMVGSTGYIVGTPTTAGTYTVSASVWDGLFSASRSFSWTITGQTATAPTLVSPSGAIATTTPEYVWNAALGAASYVVTVTDSTQAAVVQASVSATQVGCPTGGTCRLQPGIALAPGTATWRVQAVSSTATSAWSAPLSFAVPVPVDATAPSVAITSPTSALTFQTATAAVAVGGTAADNVGVKQITWSTDRGASGTASGTGSWTAAITMAGGINVVTVTAADAAGNKASDTITVSYVAAAVPLSPTGTVTTSTPSFVWTPAPGASSYVLKVSDSTTASKIDLPVTPATACGSTQCTVAPNVTLAPGTARWFVQSVGANGALVDSAVMTFTVPDLSRSQQPAVLVSPTGTIATNLPQFSWKPAPGATGYVLRVDDSMQVGRIMLSLTPSQAACSTSVCAVAPGITIAPGAAQWTVKALYGTDGPWSAPLSFTVPSDTLVPTVRIVSPTKSSQYTTGRSTITIAGTASDSGGITSIIAWGPKGNIAITGTGNWQSALIPLIPGPNLIAVVARDAAGNVGTDTIVIWYKR